MGSRAPGILAIKRQGLIDLDFDVELIGFSLAEIDFTLEDAREANADTRDKPEAKHAKRLALRRGLSPAYFMLYTLISTAIAFLAE